MRRSPLRCLFAILGTELQGFLASNRRQQNPDPTTGEVLLGFLNFTKPPPAMADNVGLASPLSMADARPMQVRRAQPRDAAAIEALYRVLVPGDGSISVSPDRIAVLEENPTSHLLVADLDDAVCGSAFLTICLDVMYGFQPYGVVENVIVLPTARRSGVGAALMKGLERVARDARCTKLMLLSSQSRVNAHKFFLRLGFDGERKRGFVKYLNRSF